MESVTTVKDDEFVWYHFKYMDGSVFKCRGELTEDVVFKIGQIKSKGFFVKKIKYLLIKFI